MSNTTAEDNTAVGYDALYANTTGANSVAVGFEALNDNTTGAKNIGIGFGAGDAITTGSNNTIIGDYAGSTTLADTLVIAAGTTERIKVDGNGLYVNGSLVSSGASNITSQMTKLRWQRWLESQEAK
mgnify:CR=1 FL=1